MAGRAVCRSLPFKNIYEIYPLLHEKTCLAAGFFMFIIQIQTETAFLLTARYFRLFRTFPPAQKIENCRPVIFTAAAAFWFRSIFYVNLRRGYHLHRLEYALSVNLPGISSRSISLSSAESGISGVCRRGNRRFLPRIRGTIWRMPLLWRRRYAGL